MNDDELDQAFFPLWSDALTAEDYPSRRPILAHYTSLQTLEHIVKGKEFWLSNPLLMNDTQEVRQGLYLAADCIRSHEGLKDMFGPAGADQLVRTFSANHYSFSTKDAFDTYVGSFSEHEADDEDGLLSMWRAYGANGSGAAIIFDTASLSPPKTQAGVVLGRVRYGTDEQRKKHICERLDEFCRIASNVRVGGEHVGKLGKILFNRFLMVSLFSKHRGFHEEREWRVAYLPFIDPDKSYQNRFHYFNGPRGVEPKFKLVLADHPEFGGNLTLDKVITKILLGPTAATALSAESVRRMLKMLNQPNLAERVKVSGIPFRG